LAPLTAAIVPVILAAGILVKLAAELAGIVAGGVKVALLISKV
jgi:hypothetical protein